jgi:transcriptional regulator with XRE-family HTH domain
MGTQSRPVGEIITSLRRENGLTQDRLAELANVDRRTIQRAEAGDAISAAKASAIADALGVESTTLFGPHSITKLLELAGQLMCGRCGSPLAERTTVDHEYGDCEWDRFECG